MGHQFLPLNAKRLETSKQDTGGAQLGQDVLTISAFESNIYMCPPQLLEFCNRRLDALLAQMVDGPQPRGVISPGR
jgi:hypothetical protein